MISTQESVYKFKLESDKLDSQDNIDIPIPTILIYLNKAQLNLIVDSFNTDNPLRTGIEGNQKRISDLQILEVKDEPLINLTEVTKDKLYTADLLSLTKGEWLLYRRSYILANQKNCSDRILANIEVKSNELNDALLDPNRKPSFNFQETLIQIAQDKIWIYADNFTPTKLKLDYIKYPQSFDLSGYTHFNGTLSINSDSNLPDYLVNDIVSLAVKLFNIDTNNVQQTQLKQAELITRE